MSTPCWHTIWVSMCKIYLRELFRPTHCAARLVCGTAFINFWINTTYVQLYCNQSVPHWSSYCEYLPYWYIWRPFTTNVLERVWIKGNYSSFKAFVPVNVSFTLTCVGEHALTFLIPLMALLCSHWATGATPATMSIVCSSNGECFRRKLMLRFNVICWSK